MFDMGFAELLLIFVIGLLVLGPERLPTAIRTISVTVGRLRRSFNSIREEIEREVGADEIRQDLHNEDVMKSLHAAEQQLSDLKQDIEQQGRETDAEMTALEEELRRPSEQPLRDPDTATTPEQRDKTESSS